MITGGGHTASSDDAVLVASVATAASAGAHLIQIREHALEGRHLVRVVRACVAAVAGSRTRVLVNDRLDVALAAGAHGVHLPSHAMDARAARAIVPDGFLIGRSVHSEAEAVEAERSGCDYLVFGSVFASGSKPAGHAVAGLDALARVCQRVALPVLAIGGVTLARVPSIVAAGAAGIAAIGLFADADAAGVPRLVLEIRSAFRRM
jgi:thiamine-phosphate diphosphorylase